MNRRIPGPLCGLHKVPCYLVAEPGFAPRQASSRVPPVTSPEHEMPCLMSVGISHHMLLKGDRITWISILTEVNCPSWSAVTYMAFEVPRRPGRSARQKRTPISNMVWENAGGSETSRIAGKLVAVLYRAHPSSHLSRAAEDGAGFVATIPLSPRHPTPASFFQTRHPTI